MQFLDDPANHSTQMLIALGKSISQDLVDERHPGVVSLLNKMSEQREPVTKAIRGMHSSLADKMKKIGQVLKVALGDGSNAAGGLAISFESITKVMDEAGTVTTNQAMDKLFTQDLNIAAEVGKLDQELGRVNILGQIGEDNDSTAFAAKVQELKHLVSALSPVCTAYLLEKKRLFLRTRPGAKIGAQHAYLEACQSFVKEARVILTADEPHPLQARLVKFKEAQVDVVKEIANEATIQVQDLCSMLRERMVDVKAIAKDESRARSLSAAIRCVR